VHNILTPKI